MKTNRYQLQIRVILKNKLSNSTTVIFAKAIKNTSPVEDQKRSITRLRKKTRKAGTKKTIVLLESKR